MITFKEKLDAAPEWQKNRYIQLRAAAQAEHLTDAEESYLLWLAGWDRETADAFKSIFRKIKGEADLVKLANAGMSHACGLYPQE